MIDVKDQGNLVDIEWDLCKNAETIVKDLFKEIYFIKGLRKKGLRLSLLCEMHFARNTIWFQVS